MINLTPHAITIRTDTGDLTVPPSGTVARVETREEPVQPVTVNGSSVPTICRKLGSVTGLPDDGTTPVLVSSMVLSALEWRPNTYAPDTGPSCIRDDAGHIVAVTRLASSRGS